jgi:HK97 family phage major capsid protein
MDEVKNLADEVKKNFEDKLVGVNAELVEVKQALAGLRETDVAKSKNVLHKEFGDYIISKGAIVPKSASTPIKTTDGYGIPTLVDDVYKAIKLGSLMRKTVGDAATPRARTYSSITEVVAKSNPEAELIAEGDDYPDNTDKGTKVTYSAYKFGSTYGITEEANEDTVLNVIQDFSDDAARAVAKKENKYFFVGAGVAEPQGIMVGGTVAVTTASASEIVYQELVDLDESLPEEYQEGAAYFGNSKTFAAIRGLKDSTGQPLIKDYMDGRYSTLFGRPIIRNNNIEAIAAGKAVLCLGNRSGYGIGDRSGGVRTFVYLDQASGATKIRWNIRTDGKVLDPTAFQILKMKA